MTPFLLLLAAQNSYPAFEEAINDNKLVILCDPKRFRFSIRANASAASVDRNYPRRTVIDPSDLMAPLPGYTGTPEVMGPLVRYERCGPYTIRLEGDAYNGYVQGESGAYAPFLNIRVIAGNVTTYPKDGPMVRFTQCDRLLPRARPCPDGYAVRLDAEYDSRRRKLVMIETTSSDADGVEGSIRTTKRRIERDAEWSQWRSAEDS